MHALRSSLVVVAQLKAEIEDAVLRNDFEACADLKKRVWNAEAGILSDQEIAGARAVRFFLSIFIQYCTTYHSLKYNSQRLNQRNRG